MDRSPGDVDIGAWRDFPVQSSPRPVVLLDLPVKIGDEGFVDVAAKVAWINGSVRTDVALPDGLLALITAGRSPRNSSDGVTLTAVDAVHAEFLCDRGPRLLPAYRLTATGLRQPCIVLDPQVKPWWPPSESLPHYEPPFGTATIENDDVTVHLWAFGGVLTKFHRAEFIEYDTVIIGSAITTEASSRHEAVIALGVNSMVTGRLTSPLGGRVLLNQEGDPLPVLPTSVQST